jgi:hypothetical protein
MAVLISPGFRESVELNMSGKSQRNHKEGNMGKLKTALDLLPEKIKGLVSDYVEEIEKAWMKRDDAESLIINFVAKFTLEQGQNCCDVSIAFTPEKIKDHTRFTFDERQGKLPLGKKEDEGKKEHQWEKQNAVTVPATSKTPMHDEYKCTACGATGKRFGVGWPPTLDKKFRKLEGCPGKK